VNPRSRADGVALLASSYSPKRRRTSSASSKPAKFFLAFR
jgi:hypothetical protein